MSHPAMTQRMMAAHSAGLAQVAKAPAAAPSAAVSAAVSPASAPAAAASPLVALVTTMFGGGDKDYKQCVRVMDELRAGNGKQPVGSSDFCNSHFPAPKLALAPRAGIPWGIGAGATNRSFKVTGAEKPWAGHATKPAAPPQPKPATKHF